MHQFKYLPFVTFVFFEMTFVSRQATAEVTVEEVKEAVLKELRSNTTNNSYSNAFNPAMGVVLDGLFKSTKKDLNTFQFRSAEVSLEAAVDPFLRAYFIVNGNDEEVEVEEASVVTTHLPRGLQLRAGRYFANFGRLPKFHDHELPFVERTPSLERFFDGEAKADGVELNYLLPLPFYLQATLGATNKIGAENTRLEETVPSATQGDINGRPGKAFTYNGRFFTYIPIGDRHGIDLGVSEAYTPMQRFIGGVRNNLSESERILTGADITYRYEPGTLGWLQKITWGTEVFSNSERRRQENAIDADNDGIGDTDTFERKNAKGGYSFIEASLGRLFRLGGFYDVAQDLDDPENIKTKTYGYVVNYVPSEFQRIRLQYSRQTDSVGTETDNQFFVQWMATIGRHAHTFKAR